jgi:hypothetical protein
VRRGCEEPPQPTASSAHADAAIVQTRRIRTRGTSAEHRSFGRSRDRGDIGVESVVWGCYLLGRSALRLTVLLSGTLTGFLAVVMLTGTPLMLMLVLVAWSIHYAIRQLATDGEEAPTAGPATGVAIAQPVR